MLNVRGCLIIDYYRDFVFSNIKKNPFYENPARWETKEINSVKIYICNFNLRILTESKNLIKIGKIGLFRGK